MTGRMTGTAFRGRGLHVDLSTGAFEPIGLSNDLLRKYAGSRGINAWLLWNNAGRGCDPLGEANPLIISSGTLTGTIAPASGRTTVTTRSPLSGAYLKCSVGGHFGVQLKRAGYDLLFVTGKSQDPVYLVIAGDSISLKKADHLWGKEVPATTSGVRGELGLPSAQVACIGPAGENLASMASIMFSVWNTAARGGVGAVMGSKNLKAIAVQGAHPVEVRDPSGFWEESRRVAEALLGDQMVRNLHAFGTVGLVTGNNVTGVLPSYNFRCGRIEGGEKLGGEYLVEHGYVTRRLACAGCPIGCHRFTFIGSGPYAGTRAGGPEFETASSLGSGCGIANPEAMLKANQLCNVLGLDSISTGSVIQWAMESFERGVVDRHDTGGLDLSWGNEEAVIALITMIAHKEGIGEVLSRGVHHAADQFGGDSWKWAVEAKGIEQSRVDVRPRKGYALSFAVNPRGPDHLHAQVMAESGRSPAARKLVARVCGSDEYAVARIPDKKPELVKWHEECYAAGDSLGFCSFVDTMAYDVSPSVMARLFRLGTGIDMDEDTMMTCGRRTLNLERCINVREGFGREDDRLPWRMMNEPLQMKDGSMAMIERRELEALLDRYYELHGWDAATGKPTRETLSELGLDDVARALDL